MQFFFPRTSLAGGRTLLNRVVRSLVLGAAAPVGRWARTGRSEGSFLTYADPMQSRQNTKWKGEGGGYLNDGDEVLTLCTEIGGVEGRGRRACSYFWEPLPPQLVCRACPNSGFAFAILPKTCEQLQWHGGPRWPGRASARTGLQAPASGACRR